MISNILINALYTKSYTGLLLLLATIFLLDHSPRFQSSGYNLRNRPSERLFRAKQTFIDLFLELGCSIYCLQFFHPIRRREERFRQRRENVSRSRGLVVDAQFGEYNWRQMGSRAEDPGHAYFGYFGYFGSALFASTRMYTTNGQMKRKNTNRDLQNRLLRIVLVCLVRDQQMGTNRYLQSTLSPPDQLFCSSHSMVTPFHTHLLSKRHLLRRFSLNPPDPYPASPRCPSVASLDRNRAHLQTVGLHGRC